MCSLLMIFKGLSKINENKITEQKNKFNSECDDWKEHLSC